MKKYLLICLLIVPLLLLSECTQTVEKDLIDIELHHGWGGIGDDHIAMRQIYADYTKKRTNVRLSINTCPYSSIIIDKANNLLAVDKMPDIVLTSGISSFLSYAKKKNMALDLIPFIQEDVAFKNNIHPQILKTWTDDQGALYTIPDVLEIIGYWYNEDIFKQAKITDDGTVTGQVVIPKTWSEFWDACDKIQAYNTENGTTINQFELHDDFSTSILIGARIAGYNSEGTVFMNTLRPHDFDNIPFKNSLIDMKKLKNYNISILTTKTSDARYNFSNNNSAMYISGVWDNIFFEKSSNKDSLKYATFPGYDGHTISFVSPSSGYVISNTQSEESILSSIDFIKYMVSTDVQTRIALETKQVPQNPNINISLLEHEVPLLGNALKVSNSASIQILTPETLWDIKITQLISTNLSDIVNDKKTVDELITAINKILSNQSN